MDEKDLDREKQTEEIPENADEKFLFRKMIELQTKSIELQEKICKYSKISAIIIFITAGLLYFKFLYVGI